jgi:SAM-dependent methyltransferase
VGIYERYAEFYDESGQIGYSLRMIPYLWQVLERHGFQGNSALDLACGTGTMALAMAQRGWRAYGVDASAAMLAQARRKAEEAGLPLLLSQQDMRTFILPERVDSVNRAMARFDFVPPLVMNTIGVMAVEVSDAEGVIVAAVDAGSAGAQAGLKVGDIITKADGQVAKAPGVFQRVLGGRKPGEKMSLEVMDRAGATRTMDVPVEQRARLISPADQTLLFNPLVLALRTRLATANAVDQPTVRLNLGVALMRLGDYAGAREQFEAVQLSEGPGVSKGTQQYLLGLAYEGTGDTAAAQSAWQQAAKSEAWLTEDGPAIRALAERKLAGRPGSN